MNTNGGDGWMDAHEKGEMNGQLNDIMNALVFFHGGARLKKYTDICRSIHIKM